MRNVSKEFDKKKLFCVLKERKHKNYCTYIVEFSKIKAEVFETVTPGEFPTSPPMIVEEAPTKLTALPP